MKFQTVSQIALNLDELPKTKSLPHLASARPKRQKSKRPTQNSVKSAGSTENADELKEFEEFFPKVENSTKSGVMNEAV